MEEAHGIGVLGPTGAGAAEHLGVLDDIDIIRGTFSKSLASVGGFVASTKEVVDYLKLDQLSCLATRLPIPRGTFPV